MKGYVNIQVNKNIDKVRYYIYNDMYMYSVYDIINLYYGKELNHSESIDFATKTFNNLPIPIFGCNCRQIQFSIIDNKKSPFMDIDNIKNLLCIFSEFIDDVIIFSNYEEIDDRIDDKFMNNKIIRELQDVLCTHESYDNSYIKTHNKLHQIIQEKDNIIQQYKNILLESEIKIRKINKINDIIIANKNNKFINKYVITVFRKDSDDYIYSDSKYKHYVLKCKYEYINDIIIKIKSLYTLTNTLIIYQTVDYRGINLLHYIRYENLFCNSFKNHLKIKDEIMFVNTINNYIYNYNI